MSGEEILVCAVQLGENFCLYFAGNYYSLLKETHCVFFLHIRSKADTQFNPFLGLATLVLWNPAPPPTPPAMLPEQSSKQLQSPPLRRMLVLKLWTQAVHCKKNLRQLSQC